MEQTSSELFHRAKEVIPGGVNSPVRAFTAVGGDPVFMARGDGAHLYDVDGREYVDYVASWGPLILGHAHPAVVAAVREAAGRGLSFGAPTEAEIVLAETICNAFDSIESVRLVNSGTEATMSAIRLARAFTGRDAILKMQGCYHGHVDSLLIEAGSGAITLGIPGSPGVPEAVVRDTLSVPFNDASLVQELVETRGEEIACLIVEPVPANMGLVLPCQGYLELLRELTEEYGILLVFDEVITGFRACYGGAQTIYGIRPDLTCLGKVIGGGMPVGAYGGRREIMEHVAPAGDVYQAGTLSGNPVATAAGAAQLKELMRPGVYRDLEVRTTRLVEGVRAAGRDVGVAVEVAQLGSCFTIFFAESPVRNHADARLTDTERHANFFHAMLGQGIYLAPSAFETQFVSTAHTDADIDRTIDAVTEALRKVAG